MYSMRHTNAHAENRSFGTGSSYVVTVTQTGYEPLRIPAVVVKPGSNTFDFPISFTSRGPTVRGTVTDRQSGKPIHLTTVGIESSAGLLARSDITDYTGYYSLLDVPTGDQVFRITAQGYQTKRYTNAVTDGLNMNILLDRSSTWSPPAEPSTGAPIARVAQPFIYLSNLAQSALLDASPSTGSGLQFIWRESRDNPGALDLIPAGSESLSQVTIGGFKVPGIYVFEVQVRSGTTVSPNTTATTIFAPGLAGNVHASPSDGLAGLPLATVRAYSAYDDALNWRGNFVDSKATDDNPVGDFSLDGLTAGTYWIVAQAQTGSGYKQYGPVRHRVNHSSAARQLQVNLSKDEYQLSGIITDTDTSMPLENVRMVIMPGSQTESFRTTTDAYGYYRLSAVPKGPQIVMLTKDGYRARVFFFDIPAGNTVFSRTMRRNTASPANLSGMVTADYHGIALPVANAEITLGDGLIRVFTDGSGRYEIRGLPPGDYFGTMRKEGYIPTDLGDLTLFTLLEGDNTIDKTLTFNDHGPVVRGTVIDQNGQPIDGVTISVLQPPAAAVQAKRPPSDGPDPTATVVSDPAGIFQMIGVPHGPRQLQISLPDGTTFTNEVEIYGSLDLVIPVAQATDDADGDGLPDAWEILYFGSIQNASPTDDPDGDRMTNLQEWLAGTVPTNALSRFQFSTVVRQPDGRAVLSWPSVDGRTYSLAWSTNVGITGSFSVLNASIPATPPINTYTDSMHTNSSRGFYQLRLNIVSP